MKKIAILASLSTLVFQSDATLTTTGWKEKNYMFSQKTDLAYGLVLNLSELPKNMRYWGNIKCDASRWDYNNPNICSYKDKGLDSMYKLLIQLFPSAGVGFNAGGAGSLSQFCSKRGIDLVDVIAGMFKISEKYREENFEGICDDELLADYFGLKMKEGNGYSNYDKLFHLKENISNAIRLERKYKDEKKIPYPTLFTNYLISAYAWDILTDNQLELLAQKLGYKEGRAPYDSEFTKKVINDIEASVESHFVPFDPGQHIISNDMAMYKGKSFADCAETTLRQFVVNIFCKSIDYIDENGRKTSKLDLALERIPENATALREFFAPGGVPRNVRDLVNDGSRETRTAWAEIVSGCPNIDYCKKDCELDTGWSNFIKIFCYLMKEYSEVNGSKEAAECIKAVNDAVETGSFSLTKESFLKTLNDLLKIRTDVEMIAKEGEDLVLKGSEVYGKISIYPNLGKGSKDIIERNTLNFSQTSGHAELKDIPNNSQNNLDRKILWDFDKFPWIEQLYYDRVRAIRGKEYGEKYPMLEDSRYPMLEYPFRMGGGVRREWLPDSMIEMLGSPTPHMDTIFRKDTPGNGCMNFANMLISSFSGASWSHFDERYEIEIKYTENRRSYVPIPSLEQIKMLWTSPSTLKKGKCLVDFVSCLENIAPGEASTLFLDKDEDGKERLNVDLTDKTSIDELIALRVATKHCSEIDPFIERFIETTYKKSLEEDIDEDVVYEKDMENNFQKVLNVFDKFKEMKKKGKLSDIPRFPRSTFDIFIKYVDFVRGYVSDDWIEERITDAFRRMDYDKDNDTVKDLFRLYTQRKNREFLAMQALYKHWGYR